MFEEKQDIDVSISTRIKFHLQESKISYPKMAEAMECSRDMVFSYANGKIPEDRMNIAVLKKMAAYFGKETYYFCNEYHVFVDTVDVPEYLKEVRKARGMSQKEFAAACNISLSAYKKYETGAVRIPEKYYRIIVDIK